MILLLFLLFLLFLLSLSRRGTVSVFNGAHVRVSVSYISEPSLSFDKDVQIV